VQLKKNAEQKQPFSDLEIGLPKGEYFRKSKIIWEQSDHVDLTENGRLHAAGPKAAGNMVSVCIECDRKLVPMFRKQTIQLRYQGQEIIAYAAHEYQLEGWDVHLQKFAAIELKFLFEAA
jgi:hypothetical protein